MGEKKIKRLQLRLLVAVVAPLVLAACGLPVGVQIASLFADGLSLLTTEKTLTDHGLSAVTNQDCAVWRGLKGDDICRVNGTGTATVAEAGAGTQAPPWTPPDISSAMADAGDGEVFWITGEAPAPPDAAEAIEVAEETVAPSEETAVKPALPANVPVNVPVNVDVSGLAAEDAPVPGSVDWARPAEPDPAGENKGRASPPPPKMSSPPAEDPTPLGDEAKPKGGTFYVIASFRRVDNATRFVRRLATLATTVLAGAVEGRPVFRVAVGPVAKLHRRAIHAGLVEAGFDDAWALELRKPKVVAERAALNERRI